MKRLLEGKTVVVTGCASGIGLETARVCKAWGATVLGIDRAMTHEHVDALYKADLADPQMIKALLRALPAGLHGIVNAASVPPTAPAERILQVNWVGLKAFTLGMVPSLADGASIVNVAGHPGAGWADHVSTILESERLEHDDVADFLRSHASGDDDAGARWHAFGHQALVTWTLTQRWTWRDRGIRMNAVSPDLPGPTAAGEGPDVRDARAAQGAPVTQRTGTPADVAPVIAFLLSDASGWIRGANIPVDGGLSSHLLCRSHGLS